jgi:hypothetical protein
VIKIENSKLGAISQDYFDGVKVLCLSRATFFSKVLNVLSGHLAHTELRDDKLNGTIKKSLINVLLRRHKLRDQNSYHQVVFGNCYGTVSRNIALWGNVCNYLTDESNLSAIIQCNPLDALQVERNFMSTTGMSLGQYKTIAKPLVNSIISYNLFDKFAYQIANNLGLNTCPYCNRISINTIIDKRKKNIIRPTFDHFFSQKDHPLLALSFYNLIPSCYYCNSNLKGFHPMSLDTHLHPYLEGFGDDFKFNFLFVDINKDKSHATNYSIFLQTNLVNTHTKYIKVLRAHDPSYAGKDGNVNLFKLISIYQAHRDVVGELIVKCDKLSKGHSDSLHRIFELMHTNKAEFYRYYFANYFDENDFHRRPLAKLTKDVIRQVLPHYLK